MTDTLTTTVTFRDLREQYADELDRARNAYEDIVATAREKYGDDALDRPAEDDTHAALQQQAFAYNETGKTIQKRQHALDVYAERYGDGDTAAFEVAILSGSEVADIETRLRMDANGDDPPDTLTVRRRGLVTDTATVDAPEGFPTDDDGSPLPSDAPNAVTTALYEYIEKLNQSGDADFTAPGFGNADPSLPSASSPRPTTTDDSPPHSPTTDATTPTDGSN